MSVTYILDAWALLALLQKEEPAATRVRSLLQQAQQGDVGVGISIINLGEVYYILSRSYGEGEARETVSELQQLPLDILPATEERVFAAAGLKAKHVISYADAFAAAAALEQTAVLLTGDPELRKLQDKIQLENLSRAGK